MLIEFDQAIVSTPQAEVLRGVSAALDGRRIGIVGPNGAGKSTLARLVNGLVLPSSGSVRVGGLDTRHELKAVRRQVGFVFQNPENQIVFPIVREELAFGARPASRRSWRPWAWRIWRIAPATPCPVANASWWRWPRCW